MTDASLLIDGDFERCPGHGIGQAAPLIDLWTVCDGSVAELLGLVPSASAALVDAWGVMRREMSALRAELRRRASEGS